MLDVNYTISNIITITMKLCLLQPFRVICTSSLLLVHTLMNTHNSQYMITFNKARNTNFYQVSAQSRQHQVCTTIKMMGSMKLKGSKHPSAVGNQSTTLNSTISQRTTILLALVQKLQGYNGQSTVANSVINWR